MLLPRYNVGTWTVVHDVESQEAIMQLDGVIVLPVGSTIELIHPNRTARVVGVRLLAPATWSPDQGDKAVHVCLDVQIEKLCSE